MIFQGLFNILDLYFNEIDFFYDNIDSYFYQNIENFLGHKNLEEGNLSKEFKEILSFLKKIFIDLGFKWENIVYKFSDQFLRIRKDEIGNLNTPIKRYKKKISPIIYEIFLEKIVDYLIAAHQKDTIPMMVNLKSKGLLPIEFAVELRNLKSLLEKYPEKQENLRKYIEIRNKIIYKFSENKYKIESLEELENPRDKLQLIYLIYRIIDFFNLQKDFDFSHIKAYIENEIDEWLISIPLITLKNPDLYFCGIYLAKQFNIKIDKKKVIEFLLNLYEENIDEFEAPLIEATDRLYYYFKSTHLSKLKINEEQINELIKGEPIFFEKRYLKNLETSQLGVILKIYRYLEIFDKIGYDKIKAINEEIEQRITPEGIRQFRDGFITSEATYYILFYYYTRNILNKLKDYDLLNNIVSRIYRNLEILDFSEETNYDLVSELFYSCESLKLFNCIETKEMITHLANYLFPNEIVNTVLNSKNVIREQKIARFRHLKVDRITGETIY